jgi:intein/homing endonuclease
VDVQISTHPNVLHIHTSYLDNIENLGDEFLREVEQVKREDEKKYAHVFMGQWADIAEGVVFKNIELVDEIPEHVKKRGYGMDFGYSIDETAIIDCGLVDNDLYLDEICYKTKMLTGEIVTELKKNRHKTISESADPRLIQEIANAGILIYPVSKGPDSILAGIQKMLDLNIKVTKRSYNLLHEFRNYTWDKDKDGNYINMPIDKYNHCFSGDTLILTNNGAVQIKDIKPGNLVLTSKGCRIVNKLFKNGCKKILHIRLIFHNFVIEIKATSEHKFKTDKGWKELRELKATDILYLSKYLMGKSIIYTKEKDIFQEEQSDCISLFGNFTTGKYPKGTKYIIEILIRQIMRLKILFACQYQNMDCCIKNKEEKEVKAKNKSLILTKFEKKQKYGTQAKREENGMLNTEKEQQKNERIKNLFVKFVEKFIFQRIIKQNSVLINAGLNSGFNPELITKRELANCAAINSLQTSTTQIDFAVKCVLEDITLLDETESDVYDLEVNNMHEYFANGILVHNCIDASRYWVLGEVLGKIQSEQGYTYRDF